MVAMLSVVYLTLGSGGFLVPATRTYSMILHWYQAGTKVLLRQ